MDRDELKAGCLCSRFKIEFEGSHAFTCLPRQQALGDRAKKRKHVCPKRAHFSKAKMVVSVLGPTIGVAIVHTMFGMVLANIRILGA